MKRAKKVIDTARPLREFVYLDEVSLTSLLVSQRDTIPEHVTSGRSVSEQAEISAKASVDAVAAKAESATRYQTANSSSVESSRKAVVQTLFNELRDDAKLPIALRDDAVGPVSIPVDSATEDGGHRGWRGEDLLRGQLIELEVVLEVDPVFKLGTMVSEFSAMAAEYPQMAGPAGLAMLDEIEPVKKVLDRLLAGLIPIRATACNYVVATVDGHEYVVRSSTASELGVPVRPLEIVGVTEHIGYWKDIRRVLFSSGQFKLLCRVARPGLHETWTPVKVAHLFGDVAPSLVEQIDTLSKAGTTGLDGLASGHSHPALVRALAAYADQIASMTNQGLRPSAAVELIEIAARASDEASPSAQRQAFAAVRELIVAGNPDSAPTPEQDLDARRIARQLAGLPVLPGGSIVATADSTPEHVADAPADTDVAKLIDVEVVAIYW
ncbi:DUF6414 family protein [Cellulosimicrobium arenosum]|uniref:Uncharacterized protein n=1 Tax=Cellulosimicrobium arenosum TaxID=2708133 RepID=A0A927G799_9MICO|nr:hypothetical protein [Cellulosimicrobium arenosum]MBD8078209.1 hypothetical protein [Cellulosimicrobium arenosum]